VSDQFRLSDLFFVFPISEKKVREKKGSRISLIWITTRIKQNPNREILRKQSQKKTKSAARGGAKQAAKRRRRRVGGG
jgi:hypothetical protein